MVRLNIDQLLVVGDGARPLFVGAVNEGSWGAEAEHVSTLDEAESLLADRLQPGDIVLVKASNAVRLWRVAEALLTDPAGGAA